MDEPLEFQSLNIWEGRWLFILVNIVNQDDTKDSIRQSKNLPPFFKLVSLIISGKNEIELQNFSIKLKNKLTKLVNTDILGPVNAPIFKIKSSNYSMVIIRIFKHFLFHIRL